jgi:hypothetical protein
MMIGVDYHPSFQQISFLMEETGEYSEQRLNHSDGEAEQFYRDLKLRSCFWFQELCCLAEGYPPFSTGTRSSTVVVVTHLSETVPKTACKHCQV